MTEYESRIWFVFFIFFFALTASAVLATDIATDYVNAFTATRASLYFVAWEVTEISLSAAITGWLVYRASNKSVSGRMIVSIIVSVLPTAALLVPDHCRKLCSKVDNHGLLYASADFYMG